MRLIDADALKREMWRRCGETDIEIDKGRAKWDSGLWIRYKVFEECIVDAPAIEAEPNSCEYWDSISNGDIQSVKHGRWEMYGAIKQGTLVIPIYRCSECKEDTNNWFWHYCPHCGAKMDEVTE